jgi:hypothetical protein
VTNNETGGELPAPPPGGRDRGADEPRAAGGGSAPAAPGVPAGPEGSPRAEAPPVDPQATARPDLARGLPPPPGAISSAWPAPPVGLPGPPLDVGGMIEWSFRTFVRNWRQLALIVLVTRGLVTLLYLLAGGAAAATGGAVGPTTLVLRPGEGSLSGSEIAIIAVLAIVDFVVVEPAFTAALGRATIGTYLGEAPSADRSLRFGLRRFGSILLITVLRGLLILAIALPFLVLFGLAAAASDGGPPAPIVIAAGLPAVIAALYIGTRLSLVNSAFVAEGSRGRSALRRSWNLTRGRFWKVLGVILVGSFLAGVVTFAVTTVTAKVAPGGGLPAAAIRAVGAMVAQCASVPFVALLGASLFFSVKASKEPFDPALSFGLLRGLDRR